MHPNYWTVLTSKLLSYHQGRIANAKNLTYGQQKDLIEKLSDPNNHDFDEELAEGTPRTREKFAGLISDTVWKNNPNSDYNKQNNKYPQMSREAYEDQRQYFLHRKNLAENIEKARRADDNKIKEKELADKREKEAQALRAANKKKYMEKKKSIKMQQMLQNQEDEEGDIQLRDGRTRVVNVQMISQEMFSVSTNFVMPEEIEFAVECLKYCQARKICVDLIPQMVFDLFEFKVPFSDTSKISIVNYDYHEDFDHKANIQNLPKSLYAQLYHFQRVGVQFGIDHHGRCLIGDEMGVGKTIQAISISYLYKKDWPLLIITPSSLRFTWRDELMNWLGFIKEEDIQVLTSSQDCFSSTCQIYIISYNIATRLAGLIDRKKFGMTIVDEAHYLKSRDSKRARNLVPVLMKMKRILLLSGTPILARPNEIYNLTRILRPDIFYSFKEFGLRYCNPKESYFGIDWTGAANNRELYQTLKNSFMIRRMKQEVLTELPAKRRQRISISTDSNQVKKIHYMLKKVKNWQDKIGRKGENAFGDLTDDFDGFVQQHGDNMMADPTFSSLDDKYSYLVNAYGLTGTAKIKGIQEFIETLLENRCKFLIFAHHYDVLDAIEDTVIKKKVSHIRIDGKIDVTKRYEAVRKFQTDSECLVAVLSLTASCTGITLTAASTVVFAEMNWTPGIMVQAEDRAHRIGQINSVNVYYLFGENTLDAMIYPRLKLKSEVFANVVDGKGTDFRIDNEDEAREYINKQIQDKKNNGKLQLKFEKISNSTNQSQLDMQQSNISDFFFVKNKVSSKIKHDFSSNQSNFNEDSVLAVDPNDSSSLSLKNAGPEKIMRLIEKQNHRNSSNQNDVDLSDQDRYKNKFEESMSEDEELGEYMLKKSKLVQQQVPIKDYQHPDNQEFYMPEPPLASSSSLYDQNNGRINIFDEDWDEGTDTKQKAYQKLRADKNKMFEENKIFKKFTSQFKGLKRIHQRAKKPNKITEYELPRDPGKTNRKIQDFDPGMLLEMEFQFDEERKIKQEEKLYGKRKSKNEPDEVEIVKVTHLNKEDKENRVLSIREELMSEDNTQVQTWRQMMIKKEDTQTTSLTQALTFQQSTAPNNSTSFTQQTPLTLGLNQNQGSSNLNSTLTTQSRPPQTQQKLLNGGCTIASNHLDKWGYYETISKFQNESDVKREIERKKYTEMLRNMQLYDNCKIKGLLQSEIVQMRELNITDDEDMEYNKIQEMK
eukprot:403335006